MTQLTDRQKREIRFLTERHHYSSDEATFTVLRPRTKVRAPTMDELTKLKNQNKEMNKW